VSTKKRIQQILVKDKWHYRSEIQIYGKSIIKLIRVPLYFIGDQKHYCSDPINIFQ